MYPDAPKLAVGGRLRGRRRSRAEVGEGVTTLKVGDRVAAGTRFGGYAELVCAYERDTPAAARRAQLRAGRRDPGQLRHRLRGRGDDGRAARGRPAADPGGGGRRRHRRDPDREGARRRDVRHRVGLQARRDPRAGRRPPDRLPQPGLRGGGDADHRRRGDRHRLRRDRPLELPQGLPAAAAREAG